MAVKIHTQGAPSLPVRGNLKPVYAASLAIAAVTAVVSAAGLIHPGAIYPTDEFRRAFVPNDVVSLVIALPILLGSMGLALRGKWIGLLLWPGGLLFLFYNYLIYFFCMPLSAIYLGYPALVFASGIAIIGLFSAVDGNAVRERLAGAVPEKLCGGILAGLAGLFLLRAAGILLDAIVHRTPVAATILAVNASDLVVSPVWVAGGVLLWRHKPLGYAGGLGFLFSLSMLFIGLIAVMILQPFLTAAPFDAAGVLVVAVMGLVGFIPFALFLRGVLSGRKASAG